MGTVSAPHLEDEHFEVVPLQQVVVVRLQLLHLDRLSVQALLHLLHVPADFAGPLQQLGHAGGCAQVVLGQAGHVTLQHAHGLLQVPLARLHAPLVVLHRLYHVHQLVQQRHHGGDAHLAGAAPSRCRGAGGAFQTEPGEGAGGAGGGRGGRGGGAARREELRVFGLLLLLGDGVGAARAAAGLAVGRVFFHGAQVVRSGGVSHLNFHLNELRGDSVTDSSCALTGGARAAELLGFVSASTPLSLTHRRTHA